MKMIFSLNFLFKDQVKHPFDYILVLFDYTDPTNSCLSDPILDQSSVMNCTVSLPPLEFLYDDPSHCSTADQHLACSVVMPSLRSTIKWLRDCVKENPSLRVQARTLSQNEIPVSKDIFANYELYILLIDQVLVTGSLHLVGDVLKLLRR